MKYPQFSVCIGYELKRFFNDPKITKSPKYLETLYSLIEHTSTVQLIYMEGDYVSSIIGSEFK